MASFARLCWQFALCRPRYKSQTADVEHLALMTLTRRREIDIPAIRDSELRELLGAYNLQNAVADGSALCISCGKTAGWDDIAGLVVHDNSLKIVCNRPGCMEAVATGHHDR